MLRQFRQLVAGSRRITTSGDWVPEVDGIRFVAILLVLVQHAHERVLRRTAGTYPEIADGILDKILGSGSSGVLIFFTLSGYILGKILITRLSSGTSVGIKSFYLRRITRLEPPYFLVMTGIFLLLTLSGYRSSFTQSFERGATSLSDAWLASLCYSYCPIYGVLPKLNPPAWSLEVEVQFYVLAPLLAWLVTRIPRGWLRLAALGSICLVLSVTVSPWASGSQNLSHTLLKYAPYFFAGFTVLELQESLNLRRWNKTWDALAIASLVGLLLGKFWIPKSVHVAITATAALLFVAGCLQGVLLRRLLSFPLIAVIGGMCYSIYLVHLPILEGVAGVTVKYGRGLPYPLFLSVQLVLLLSVVLGCSWMFFRLIERPCMQRDWPIRAWQWILGLTKRKGRAK